MSKASDTQFENESYRIAILDSSIVKIGDENSAENRIDIEVRNKTPKKLDTRVMIKVYCGVDAKSLLSSGNDSVQASYLLTGEAKEIEMSSAQEGEQRVWRTSSRGTSIPANGDMSITLKEFRSDTLAGNAIITVLAEVDSEGGWAGMPVDFEVKKILNATIEPRLHFFRVDPDYILQAGQKQVTVSFLASSYNSAFLFRNNEQVHDWVKNDNGDIGGVFQDSPSITSVYRLVLKRVNDENQEEVSELFWRTVQVISPGWNQIALPQGSPTQLFVANDFRTGNADRLYGIFLLNEYKNSEGRSGLSSQARLYSSGTGVDNWELESSSVPEGMETSPGVVYRNRLWLIGGSAVDPNRKTKDIWCYEKDKDNTMKWIKKDLCYPPDDPTGSARPGRFGHCCVVFGDEILVLGGYDNKPHNDIWRLKASPDGQTFAWQPESPEVASWTPRCMHTATTVRSAEGGETLWICGGAESRGAARRYNDLWSIEAKSTDDKSKSASLGTWDQQTMEGQDTAIVPDPGEPVGSALVAYPEVLDGNSGEGVRNERLMLLGSFREWQPNEVQSGVNTSKSMKIGNRISSYLFEWQKITSTWDSKPVIDGWQQFQGQTFSMQTLEFNRFLYIYSLDQEALYPEEGNKLVKLKLNIRIPS